MSDNADVLEDLGVLHDAIADTLRKAFGPRLRTVGEYDPVDADRQTILTPAILLEVVEMRPAGRVTGGRTAVEVVWSAHCVLSSATDNVQREVRNFAARALRLVDVSRRWGKGEAVMPAAELEAFPGMFKPGEKGFESWIVNWRQVVHLGEAWELPDDGPAREIYLGESPNIGPGGDYERLN